MLDLATIDAPAAERLARDLEEVAVVFERQLASELSAVNALCLHVAKYRGKMLRPALVLLAARAATGDDDAADDRHRMLGAVVEMIHMATLVHDDVLDEATVRRRGSTVNHLWGNEAAVMLGDYLISNAFHLCSRIGDPDLNLALGEVTNTLCSGELLQLHHRHDHGLDERIYLEIVRRKTASLIAASCSLAARLAGAGTQASDALHRAGLDLGIAFQIQDDLLDLVGEESVVGKSLGRDLQKGKLTLPVIRLLDGADPRGRAEILGLLERGDAIGLAKRLAAAGTITEARRIAHDRVERARTEIATLPEGTARNLLDRLARAVVERRS